MQPADPESRSEETIRPWRQVIAVLVVFQMLCLFGLLVVLLIASVSDRGVAYAIAGAVLLMEVGQWALSKLALRRVPAFDPAKRLAMVPLTAAHQRLVEFNLAASVIAPVWISVEIPSTSFGHDKFLAFVLLEIAVAPGSLSLWRVRRNHTWAAISRIPSTPRRKHTF